MSANFVVSCFSSKWFICSSCALRNCYAYSYLEANFMAELDLQPSKRAKMDSEFVLYIL